MDHYYPVPQTDPSMPDGLKGRLEVYAGTFLPARNEYTTAGKLVGLFQSIRVEPASDRELVVSLGFPSQITWRYTEVAPNVFRSTDSPPSIFGDLVFQLDSRGRAQYLFQQNNPTTAYIKAPFYAGTSFNLTLLTVFMLLFILVIVWAPIGLWLRRRFQRPMPFWERFATWWQGLFSLLALLFLIGSVAVFSNAQTVYGLPAWVREFWSLPGRIHFTLVTLAGLAFVSWLAYWNLWIIHLY